ncbi:hypothetical protein C7431_102329 [Pantoea allii]|uniref:Uncharacterized protein n=1 Tax=Pantoea allii TaxID=574096 RepID=A0A2V2BKY0_9GAMM|nr:hypothetical protein C7431_102329 [Pantoea allii]
MRLAATRASVAGYLAAEEQQRSSRVAGVGSECQPSARRFRRSAARHLHVGKRSPSWQIGIHNEQDRLGCSAGCTRAVLAEC